MARKMVIESSEKPTRVIDYSSLPMKEIDSRIREYEKKYKMSFSRFSSQYSCDDASPEEITNEMDWSNLVLEKKDRRSRTSTEVFTRD